MKSKNSNLPKHLEILVKDFVDSCPFCEKDDASMHNVNCALYTISCECGAEMKGNFFPGNSMKAHLAAKKSVLDKWNRRGWTNI